MTLRSPRRCARRPACSSPPPPGLGGQRHHPALAQERRDRRRPASRPTFKMRVKGAGQVWVHVCKSKKKNADGVICSDESIGRAKKKRRHLPVQAEVLRLPRVLAQLPRAPTTGRPTASHCEGNDRATACRRARSSSSRSGRPAASDRVHIGCSGWQYRDWRDGAFYPPRLPQRRWLEHYASRFDTVEVNSTFYRLAKPEAVARWVSETPRGLRVHGQGEPLHDARQAPDGPRASRSARYYEAIEPLVASAQARPGAVAAAGQLQARRGPARRRARAAARRAATASSSGTSPGSPRTCSRSCAPTARRWSTATTRSGRGSRWS